MICVCGTLFVWVSACMHCFELMWRFPCRIRVPFIRRLRWWCCMCIEQKVGLNIVSLTCLRNKGHFERRSCQSKDSSVWIILSDFLLKELVSTNARLRNRVLLLFTLWKRNQRDCCDVMLMCSVLGSSSFKTHTYLLNLICSVQTLMWNIMKLFQTQADNHQN